MTNQEFAEVIQIMRSAPLANMEVAERVSNLINKLVDHANDLKAMKFEDVELPGCLQEGE
jgi:hypothetical protein